MMHIRKVKLFSKPEKIISKKIMENFRLVNLTGRYSYGSKSNFTGKHSGNYFRRKK